MSIETIVHPTSKSNLSKMVHSLIILKPYPSRFETIFDWTNMVAPAEDVYDDHPDHFAATRSGRAAAARERARLFRVSPFSDL